MNESAVAHNPLRWFLGFPPTPYYVLDVSHNGVVKSTPVRYLSQPNMIVMMLLWLTFPIALVEARKKKQLELFGIVSLVVLYASLFAVSFIRSMHPSHHMLLLIPSVCMVNASVLIRFPRHVILFFLFGVLAWFVVWFPLNVLGT